MYKKIKKWYLFGLWNKEMINKAVEKNIITKSQVDELLKEA